MKALTLLLCLHALVAVFPPDPAEGDGSAWDSGNEQSLGDLQREFARRKAVAIRPAFGWYQAEVARLTGPWRESTPGKPVQMAGAVRAARLAFWDEDQPELKQALSAHPWTWVSEDDSRGVDCTFSADGTVSHVGLRGTWTVTGPCAVTITADGREQFVLRFNASLSAFEGDRQAVFGFVRSE